MDGHESSNVHALGLSSSKSAELYNHSLAPLAIRILILEPGEQDSPLNFGLESTTLDDAAGTYEALSYAWGLEEASEIILCNGVTLQIRPNLAAAFRQLRSKNQSRRLWVDFLCINQLDVGERGRQVAHMSETYARASQVLLWLGAAADNSDDVLDYLAQVDASAEAKEYARVRSRQRVQDPKPHALVDPAAPIQHGDAWTSAIDKFLSRPWFRRCWVQQEAAACPRTTALCGTRSISWDHLFALAWRMMRGHNQFTTMIAAQLRSLSRPATTSLRLIRLIHLNRLRTKASLLYVLHAARVCEAADPRDRIYSVQHLARQASPSEVLMDPDYTITMSELCIRFAERYLMQRGPAILAFAGRAAQNPERASLIPSWVPDWENQTRHHLIGGRTEMAGGRRVGKMYVKTHGDQGVPSLVLEGRIVTTIEVLGGFVKGGGRHVYAEDAGPTKLPTFVEKERTTYETFINPPTAPYRDTKETLHAAYARILVADSIPNLRGVASASAQCAEWRSLLQQAMEGNEMSSLPVAEELEAPLAELQLQDSEILPSQSTSSAVSMTGTEEEKEARRTTGPQAALASSMYALNVYKTGTFAHMRVARGTDGWLLLVPSEAQVGDDVCLVRGFGRGLVIREGYNKNTQERKGQNEEADNLTQCPGRTQSEIIGEAYIHGAMHGELLPKHHEEDTTWSELEFV